MRTLKSLEIIINSFITTTILSNKPAVVQYVIILIISYGLISDVKIILYYTRYP